MHSYLTDSLLISLRPVQTHGAQLGKLLMIIVCHIAKAHEKDMKCCLILLRPQYTSS